MMLSNYRCSGKRQVSIIYIHWPFFAHQQIQQNKWPLSWKLAVQAALSSRDGMGWELAQVHALFHAVVSRPVRRPNSGVVFFLFLSFIFFPTASSSSPPTSLIIENNWMHVTLLGGSQSLNCNIQSKDLSEFGAEFISLQIGDLPLAFMLAECLEHIVVQKQPKKEAIMCSRRAVKRGPQNEEFSCCAVHDDHFSLAST